MSAFRDAIYGLHQISGLDRIESPWLSVAVTFVVLGSALYGLGRLAAYWRRRFAGHSTYYVVTGWVAVVLVVAVLGTLTVLAYVTKLSSDLRTDTTFEAYWWALFFLANVPLYVAYWRAGELRSADI